MPDETPAFLSRPISRRAWLAWAASAAATPLLAGCSSGSSTDTPRLTSTVEWGRQAIREAMQQTQTRAVSVALLYEDQLVWQEGFGTRDPAGLQATTVDTRFNIGSVSKVLAALAGVYGHSDAPYKVGISGTSQLDLLIWSGPEQTWTPLAPGLQLRADGWWYADAKPEVQYRWAQADGKRYLLTRQTVGAGHYRLSLPLGQQMPAADSPLPPAWRALVGSAWQVVNEHPQSVWASEVLTPITLTEHPELPGYLFWDERQFLKPLGDHHAGMTVQVPLNAGRDLVELVLEHRDGTQWLRTGGWLLRRLS